MDTNFIPHFRGLLNLWRTNRLAQAGPEGGAGRETTDPASGGERQPEPERPRDSADDPARREQRDARKQEEERERRNDEERAAQLLAETLGVEESNRREFERIILKNIDFLAIFIEQDVKAIPDAVGKWLTALPAADKQKLDELSPIDLSGTFNATDFKSKFFSGDKPDLQKISDKLQKREVSGTELFVLTMVLQANDVDQIQGVPSINTLKETVIAFDKAQQEIRRLLADELRRAADEVEGAPKRDTSQRQEPGGRGEGHGGQPQNPDKEKQAADTRAAMARAAESGTFMATLEKFMEKLGQLFDKLGVKMDEIFGKIESQQGKFPKSPIDSDKRFAISRKYEEGKPGIELKAETTGSAVTSVCDGKVIEASGNSVTIQRPNGDKITYKELEVKVTKKDPPEEIKAGHQLGSLKGNTLTFELTDKDNKQKDPTALFKSDFIVQQPAAAPSETLPELTAATLQNSPLGGQTKMTVSSNFEATGRQGIEITTEAKKPIYMAAPGKAKNITDGVEITYKDKKLIFKNIDPGSFSDQTVAAGAEIGKAREGGKFTIQLIDAGNGTQLDPTQLFSRYI